MGIRGLYNFISKQPDNNYFEDFVLRDSSLIIDGWNFAWQLFKRVKESNCCFGGDYNRFHKFATKFFERLLQCDITPLVIFYGAYERKTLEMMLERMETTMNFSRNFNLHRSDFTPTLLRETFFNVLTNMSIKIVICAYESESTIVALTKKLNCPLLTMNSVFFLYGIKCIPTNSLQIFGYKCIEPVMTDFEGNPLIKCQLFQFEKFQERFPGLQVEIIPLLRVYLDKDNDQDSMIPLEKIAAAIRCLSSCETFDSAVEIILKRAPNTEEKERFLLLIKEIREFHEDVCYMLNFLGDIDVTITEVHSRITSLQVEKNKLIAQLTESPQWLVKDFKAGKIHHIMMYLLRHQCYILPIRMEDYDYNSPYEISVNIIQEIFRLIMSDVKKDDINGNTLTLAMREKDVLQIREFNIKNSPLSLEEVRKLPVEQRVKMLNKFLGILDDELDDVPVNWRLYVATAVYWMKQDGEPRRSNIHLDALLFTMLFSVLDAKFQFEKYKPDTKWKYTTSIEELRDEDNNLGDDLSLFEALDNLKDNDYVMAALYFLPRFTNNILKCKPRDFDVNTIPKKSWITTVHVFAQFQCCLRHSINLNVLLGEVYKIPIIGELFNASLLYNFYTDFSKQSNVDAYINARLTLAPGFARVFRLLKKNVTKLLQNV